MIFKNNRTYDVLKWVNAIVVPAVITCFLTISEIADWDKAIVIGGIMSAVNTCIGSILGVGNIQYKKINPDVEESYYDLENMEVEEDQNNGEGVG